MSTYTNLPAPSPEQGLNRYLQEIRKFPLLEPEEEYMLAKRWVDHEDARAAHQLVTSHLRLAAKIAMGYRGYGLPQAEVISEANVGLMQAVKRFDPERGFRLATYAMWWIRASIQEYILRSWSLVKLGTTSAQKKLFFNLRSDPFESYDSKDFYGQVAQKAAWIAGPLSELVGRHLRSLADYPPVQSHKSFDHTNLIQDFLRDRPGS